MLRNAGDNCVRKLQSDGAAPRGRSNTRVFAVADLDDDLAVFVNVSAYRYPGLGQSFGGRETHIGFPGDTQDVGRRLNFNIDVG